MTVWVHKNLSDASQKHKESSSHERQIAQNLTGITVCQTGANSILQVCRPTSWAWRWTHAYGRSRSTCTWSWNHRRCRVWWEARGERRLPNYPREAPRGSSASWWWIRASDRGGASPWLTPGKAFGWSVKRNLNIYSCRRNRNGKHMLIYWVKFREI